MRAYQSSRSSRRQDCTTQQMPCSFLQFFPLGLSKNIICLDYIRIISG